jgi:ABC-2 type transport system permease protein
MNEWLLLRRDRAAIAVLLGLLLFGLVGLLDGLAFLWAQCETTRQAQVLEQAQRRQAMEFARELEATGATVDLVRDSRKAGPVGRFQVFPVAALPSAPLSSVCAGPSRLRPAYWRVSTDLRQTFAQARDLESPERLSVGRFDLEFVFVCLLPLAQIALCYGIIAADRDGDLLRQLLAQPVTISTLLLRRLAWRAGLPVAIALCLLWLAVGAGWWMSPVPGVAGNLAWSTLLLFAYGLFWASLCAWVTSKSPSGATAILRLGTAWLVLVVLIPSSVNLAGQALFPLPSRIEYLDDFRRESRELNNERTELLSRFLEDHPELAGPGVDPDEYYRRRLVLDVKLEEALAPLEERFAAQADRQRAWSNRLAPLSPCALFTSGLQRSCQADGRRFRDFERQATEFHRSLREFYRPYVFSTEPFRDHDRIPSFTFRETAEPFDPALAVPLAGLLVWTAVFAWLTRRALARPLLV